MDKKGIKIPAKRIEQAILLIRGQKVMLDTDLAALYGVPTKALNQAVNKERTEIPARFHVSTDKKRER